MRYIAQCSLLALALAWVSPAVAGELEWHGYMRAGVGLATTGGPGVCYGLATADAKFRLGNECDYVIEGVLNQHTTKLEDGSDWGVQLMPAIYRTWANGTIAAFDDLPVRFNQAYVYGSKVPQLAMGTVWAGRRYYARLQTGINDQFQQNDDGDGAGLEDMQLGPAKVSLAFLMNPNTDPAGGNPTVKPFKLEAHAFIPTVEKGELSIYASVYNNSKTVNESLGEDPPDVYAGSNQYNIGLYHKLGGILNGDNLIGFKLMSSATNMTWRAFLQEGMGFPEFRTNVDFLLYYRSAKGRADADADWGDPANCLSIGARTDTQISGPFRFMLEYGHDRTWQGDAMNNSLNKLTGALAVNAGNDPWSRPTVRLYYTQAWWNEAGGPGANSVYNHWQTGPLTRNAYGNQTAGGTFGLQGEVWW